MEDEGIEAKTYSWSSPYGQKAMPVHYTVHYTQGPVLVCTDTQGPFLVCRGLHEVLFLAADKEKFPENMLFCKKSFCNGQLLSIFQQTG